MAYYPRVRANKETPTMHAEGTEPKALTFYCYKAGMTQAIGKNIHKGSPTFGQEVAAPSTVIVCPNMKVFGIRAYKKAEIGYDVYGDVYAESISKDLDRKIPKFKTKSPHAKNKGKKEVKEKSPIAKTVADFEKALTEGKIEYFTLIVNTEPRKLGFKKIPDLAEVDIGGKKEEQLNYAKEKLGKEITIEEVVKEGEFLDIKAVTKGKGFQGVIKRFGVKMFRPKAKKQRVVGSISPWTPHTVMFTVPRPGQMGYHNRTEYNKKLIKISNKVEEINPVSGFANYGMVKEKYALIFGSVAGPAKRCIALRKTVRPIKKSGIQLEKVIGVVK